MVNKPSVSKLFSVILCVYFLFYFFLCFDTMAVYLYRMTMQYHLQLLSIAYSDSIILDIMTKTPLRSTFSAQSLLTESHVLKWKSLPFKMLSSACQLHHQLLTWANTCCFSVSNQGLRNKSWKVYECNPHEPMPPPLYKHWRKHVVM